MSLARILLGALLFAAPHVEPCRAGNGSCLFTMLIENRGAEDGPASPNGVDPVLTPSWTTTGAFTVVAYGTPGDFPTTSDFGPPWRGLNFFCGGPSPATTSASQIYLIPEDCFYTIDRGGVACELRAFLGGYLTDRDHARVRAEFRDVSGGVLLVLTTETVSEEERGGQTMLLLRGAAGTVPQGTRSVDVRIEMIHVDGPYNNALADELELRFFTGLPSRSESWSGVKSLHAP